jgi:hypothetical protein
MTGLEYSRATTDVMANASIWLLRDARVGLDIKGKQLQGQKKSPREEGEEHAHTFTFKSILT